MKTLEFKVSLTLPKNSIISTEEIKFILEDFCNEIHECLFLKIEEL